MLRAFGAKIVVSPDETPVKMSSGLFLPDSVIKTKQTGVVTSVGPRAQEFAGIGDKVVYEENAGHRVQENGITLIILNVDEILGRDAA